MFFSWDQRSLAEKQIFPSYFYVSIMQCEMILSDTKEIFKFFFKFNMRLLKQPNIEFKLWTILLRFNPSTKTHYEIIASFSQSAKIVTIKLIQNYCNYLKSGVPSRIYFIREISIYSRHSLLKNFIMKILLPQTPDTLKKRLRAPDGWMILLIEL